MHSETDVLQLEAKIERLSDFESRYRAEYSIVKRIWEILGFDEYNSNGAPKKSIYEYIEDKNSEIERLKESAKYDAFLREKYRQLITELADALAHFHPTSVEYNILLERAREAVK